jgi:hypothetical protein
VRRRIAWEGNTFPPEISQSRDASGSLGDDAVETLCYGEEDPDIRSAGKQILGLGVGRGMRTAIRKDFSRRR